MPTGRTPRAGLTAKSRRVQQPPTPLKPTPPRHHAPTNRSLKVRVKDGMTGYYNDGRKREGDVFTLADASEFSERWMEWADPTARERTTTPSQALKKVHDEILGQKLEEKAAATSASTVI